jgi:cobalt-zinc-cadmium efflux system protein
MSAGHSHALPENRNDRLLGLALALTSAFFAVEVAAGILANSLALISDAAHMFTDMAALAVALAAIRIGKRLPDSQRTFGYSRFEILAAAFNAVLLFLVAIYILVEAYQRLKNPPQIHSTAMLIVAALGLCINLVSMRLLRGGKDGSLNVKGAYLEVWSDMLGSVGVIAGALVIRWTGWAWIDSAVAVGIGLWVLPRTWNLLKESLNVLLEGVPQGIGLTGIEQAIGNLPGVASVHDLHVWAIASGKISLTVHVVAGVACAEWPALLHSIRSLLAERMDIHHVTIQVEQAPCEQANGTHTFERVLHHGHDHPENDH